MRRAREFMRKDKKKAPIETKEKDKDQSQSDIEIKEKAIEASNAEQIEEDDEEVEDEEVDFDEDFDGISDDGDDDDDTDGLLIPLENGWVCEKRLADPHTNTYSTHFWSPDGQRHSTLTAIKSYGTKKKLKLNMMIFERALKNNPHK